MKTLEKEQNPVCLPDTLDDRVAMATSSSTELLHLWFFLFCLNAYKKMEFLFPVHLLCRPSKTLCTVSHEVHPLFHHLHEGMTQSQLKSSCPWSFHLLLLNPLPKKTPKQQKRKVGSGLETSWTAQQFNTDSFPQQTPETKHAGRSQEGLNRFTKTQSIHGYRTGFSRHSSKSEKNNHPWISDCWM